MAPDTPQHPTRVTVLNDDPDVLALLRDLFEGLGYHVTAGSIATPGIQGLIDSRPDLIVVDMELGEVREELTGLQTIHSARTSTALRDVPIIVSASDLPELAGAWPDLMERGDIHRLEKPFDLRTFERVVEAATGIRHGDADASGGAGRLLAEQRDRARADAGNEMADGS